MAEQRPLSIAELTFRSKPTGYNVKKSFRTSLRIALDENEAGQTKKAGGDIEQAYIHFSRAHTLLTEELPTHPQYPQLEPHKQEAIIWKGHEVEISLNEAKAMVGRRILDWKLRHLDSPFTARARVQSESGIDHSGPHVDVPSPGALLPPSPSRSAPLLSAPTSKGHSRRGHRRTSSDVGNRASSGSNTSSTSKRPHLPMNGSQLDKGQSDKLPPSDGLNSNSTASKTTHARRTPKIIVRQPTISPPNPEPDTSISPNPTETLDTPAVPPLILTNLSGELSPSQITTNESASVVTPSDEAAFPIVQAHEKASGLLSSGSVDKTRPRTLSELVPAREPPPVGRHNETSIEPRPGSCPPVATKKIPAHEDKPSAKTGENATMTSTSSEFFTAPLALDLILLKDMDVSSDPEHPESIAKLEEEAVSYLDLGQFERATNMLAEVLKLRRRIQGDTHLFTIQTMSNLGLGYEGQGKLVQAIEVLSETLKQLDRSHPAVNLRFRSPLEKHLAELRQKQDEASRMMTVVHSSSLKRGAKRNNSADQIATRVRFDENLPAFHVDLNTTPEAIMAHLTNRRCPNLTDMIDTKRCSKVPVNRGGYGDIWQGMLTDGRPIAMKRIYQGENKINKRLAQELYAWSKANHENVLELLGIAYYRDYLVMISPWMRYGSIYDYLEQYPDTNRLHMAIQVADGIEHLHRIGMVHGDLKAQNVFVSQDGTLKVADFGLAVMLGERSVAFQPSSTGGNSSTPGTLRWMAPELFWACTAVSLESDIYSLGMTIYEIISNRIPFSELHQYMVPAAVCKEKKIPTFPSEIESLGQRGFVLWDLLRRCWDHNPRQRPTAGQVLREMHKVASH